ncbi:MAG TPA: FAD-dependent oxidoreductase [Acidobacteriota bacterium]|nr:FAD-dependent oxidoreductase [Acidobacteriota bacterium]
MSTLEEFASVVASEFPEDRLTYQKSVPTFHPECAAEAAALLKLANEHGRQLYVTGFGNNIDPAGDPFVRMLSIRTDRLNDLQEISPDRLKVRTGSGYPLREINEHLARHGLFLPHAALPYVGSAGGAVAVDLSARLGGRDLSIRDYVTEIELVTARGDVVTLTSEPSEPASDYGSVQMLAPSWGLIGLIVAVTFHVVSMDRAADYGDMKMEAVLRGEFLSSLDSRSKVGDGLSFREFKNKLDPRNVLPVV